MRPEAGSGGGPRAGRVRELPSGILWNGQPPPPSLPSSSWLRMASPKSLAWTVAPPRAGLPLSPVGAGEGGLTWCPSLRGRGLASPRTQPAPADSRPLSRGGEAGPASRAPSGPWRSGPRPRLSRLPAPFLRAVRGGGGGDRQAGARWRTRAPRTRTWKVDREGHRDPPGPQPGSGGHGDTRPLQRPRVAPSHARGPAKPSALPHGAAAAHSPWHGRARPRPPWRPSILQPLRRAPRLCRQPDKAPALGLFTISQRRVFVTCLWAPSPTRPHMPTHPHVPAPTGRAGCKPALLLGPPRSQTHTEGHNRSASPRHVKNPPQARALWGGGCGLGWRPQQGFCGWGLRAWPGDWRRAPPHRAPPFSARSPSRPAGRSPANRPPPPAGLVCAARFPRRLAVARCLKLCVSGPLRVIAPPSLFQRGRLLGSVVRTV